MKNLDYYADERERLWDASFDPRESEVDRLKEERDDLRRELADMAAALVYLRSACRAMSTDEVVSYIDEVLL